MVHLMEHHVRMFPFPTHGWDLITAACCVFMPPKQLLAAHEYFAISKRLSKRKHNNQQGAVMAGALQWLNSSVTTFVSGLALGASSVMFTEHS